MPVEPVVLYIEDDTLSREIMSMIFKYDLAVPHCTIFSDSTDFEGRLKALSPPPNMILMDIHVKPLSGFEMLQVVRRLDQFRDARVVAVTASVMNEEVQRLKDAGFNGAIAKPIDQDRFPDTFRRIVAGEDVWRIIV